ncbi:MAG: YicC family protein [Bacteroidaceae bacterium]|nr:YicC family protein [Bacteroidaceae bacterium]
MMKSMTGFAKKQCILDGRTITVEIKTLNSKGLDLIVKSPASLRSKDLEIRAMLNRLERGKVDVLITEERSSSTSAQLNTELLVERYRQSQSVAAQLGCDSQHLFETILAMPDIWDAALSDELQDEEWQAIAATISEAIDEVDLSRKHEGEILANDFVKHIALIEQKLNDIPQYENERIETAKERIRRYFAESAIKEVDPNRFEQELIYYLEKLDITEEKIRLAKHINYFRTTMEQEEGSGKKLGFIAQEMGREINTTGSKANHVEIQKLVVEMKDELEKIKEQLGNIL